tara:strand:+ start:277 stop:588 length:312 start_codon:yes stop_codon:yes gene_type:complete
MARLSKLFKVGMGALGEIVTNPFLPNVGDNVFISDRVVDGGQIGNIIGTYDEGRGFKIELDNNPEDVINVSREDVMKVTDDLELNMKIEQEKLKTDPRFFAED